MIFRWFFSISSAGFTRLCNCSSAKSQNLTNETFCKHYRASLRPLMMFRFTGELVILISRAEKNISSLKNYFDDDFQEKSPNFSWNSKILSMVVFWIWRGLSSKNQKCSQKKIFETCHIFFALEIKITYSPVNLSIIGGLSEAL